MTHDRAIAVLNARLTEAVNGLPDKRKRVDEAVTYVAKAKKEMWVREDSIRQLRASIRTLGGEPSC